MNYNWRIIRKVGNTIQILDCTKEGVIYNGTTSDSIQKHTRKFGWVTTQQGEVKLAK